jgi:hypothetical protein
VIIRFEEVGLAQQKSPVVPGIIRSTAIDIRIRSHEPLPSPCLEVGGKTFTFPEYS